MSVLSETDYATALRNLESWMPESIEIGLLPRDVDALQRLAQGDSEAETDIDGSVWDQIDEAAEAFAKPLFLRHSLGSFKPAAGGTVLPIVHAADARLLFRMINPRVVSLLSRALSEDLDISLFALEWRPIAPWAELRAFVREGQMVGLSQYHLRRPYSEITMNLHAIKSGVEEFISTIRPHLPSPNVVLDLECSALERGLHPLIIELNPFDRSTDPCLYRWSSGGDFEMGFRFLGSDGKPMFI